MSLPTQTIETYKIKLPSSGETIEIRPILVREEKIFLIGKESTTSKEFMDSLIKVVSNCLISPKGIDVGSYFSYNDFVFIFMELRKISKGEGILLNLTCSNPECTDEGKDEETGEKIKVPHIEKSIKFDLNKIIRILDERKDKKRIIKLADDLAVEMKYVKVNYVKELATEDEEHPEKKIPKISTYFMLAKHIQAVLKGEERWEKFTPEEATDWLDSLKKEQAEKIIDWVNEEPRPIMELSWKCTKCGKEQSNKEENLLRFLN
jgi:predicted aldo/keto reductase-like oxidoreductase